MNTNELMIGDWVGTPHGFGKVKGIYQYELRGQQRNEVIVDTKDGLIEFLMPELIVPIVLAGFHLYNNNLGYFNEVLWRQSKGKWNAMLHNNNDKCNTYVTYVHELQHALRLCGLNDLADNFKV